LCGESRQPPTWLRFFAGHEAGVATVTGPARYLMGGLPPGDIDWGGLVPLVGSAHATLALMTGSFPRLPAQMR